MHVRVMCLCHARVCTVVLRALSVCTVVHAVPFRAWSERVSESLGRGRPRAAPLLLCTSLYTRGLGTQAPG